MKNRKLTIAIIAVLLISLIGIGIAFAAFSQTLTINGAGTVESSSWSVVFEGLDGSSTLGAPTLTGTATEVTHPTIKNNSTEISTYEVSLKTPGDTVIYNFKIHNKGDYAASISSVILSDTLNPQLSFGVKGSSLVTDSSVYNSNKTTLDNTYYNFYYTDNNVLVGRDDGKDCLEPGESENVTLKLNFGKTSDTNKNILPKSDIVLDNLGVSVVYTQHDNYKCYYESGDQREQVINAQFINYDGTYYTYEGKSFIGTGVNNVILTETVTSLAKWASAYATECSDESEPVKYQCPEGTTPVYADHPAADAAAAYCTGCRLMTHAEANSWCGPDYSNRDKCQGYYQGIRKTWWLADANTAFSAWRMHNAGFVGYEDVNNSNGVRPAVSIPSGATISGSGTKLDPYVITVN